MADYSNIQEPIVGSDPSVLPVGTKTNFKSLFDGDCQKLAQKVLDFYDGKQAEYTEESLKKIRRNAMQSGMKARHRNIVRMIVDKSGLLFNGKPPSIEVTRDNEDMSEATEIEVVDPAQTNVICKYLESANWIEFFTNFDAVLRMLKTALVMVYWVPAKNTIRFVTLDLHNSACHYDMNTGMMDTLIYSTGTVLDDDGSSLETYRVWTLGLIQDIVVDGKGEERITNIMENPYGMIPASEFHDTNIPREGFWNSIPEDLLEINEIYNVHISDSEYSAGWNKLRTAVTNAEIKAEDSAPDFIEQQMYLNPLTRRVQAGGPAAIGGPGRIIQLETNGGVTPYFEFKGPDANLAPMDEMIKNWVIDFAADWSVNASIAANGSADSGFKLIVQEMPNLELRKKRQRMMEAGFERLFGVIKTVVNTWKPGTFTDDAELEINFSNPELPVDEKNNEMVWTMKIQEGRASRVDYFMEVKGLTREEAEQKVLEISAYNANYTVTKPAPGEAGALGGLVNTVVKA